MRCALRASWLLLFQQELRLFARDSSCSRSVVGLLLDLVLLCLRVELVFIQALVGIRCLGRLRRNSLLFRLHRHQTSAQQPCFHCASHTLPTALSTSTLHLSHTLWPGDRIPHTSSLPATTCSMSCSIAGSRTLLRPGTPDRSGTYLAALPIASTGAASDPPDVGFGDGGVVESWSDFLLSSRSSSGFLARFALEMPAVRWKTSAICCPALLSGPVASESAGWRSSTRESRLSAEEEVCVSLERAFVAFWSSSSLTRSSSCPAHNTTQHAHSHCCNAQSLVSVCRWEVLRSGGWLAAHN